MSLFCGLGFEFNDCLIIPQTFLILLHQNVYFITLAITIKQLALLCAIK